MLTVYSPRFSRSGYEVRPSRRMLGGEMFPAEAFVEDSFPRVEIIQEGHEYKLMAELPGLDKDEIRIHVRERMLTLSGEKKSVFEEELGGCRCSERYYGAFERSFPLPASARTDQVKATLEKGVLTITMPVSEEEDAGRKVDILVQ